MCQRTKGIGNATDTMEIGIQNNTVRTSDLVSAIVADENILAIKALCVRTSGRN